MSSSNSPRTICLPAHILDANISPRAREVLMLLTSQTNEKNPTLRVCQAAIAERLRCSPVTVKRAIQKLVEAKLIAETGDLHERRYKFYRVRWSLNASTPAKTAPCEGAAVQTKGKNWMPAAAGMTKKETKPAQVIVEKPKRTSALKPTEPIPPPHSSVDYVKLLKDSRIAYWAELARQKHQENLKRYRMELDILNQTNPGEFGEFKERFDSPHEEF